jgi:hypothetical protein
MKATAVDRRLDVAARTLVLASLIHAAVYGVYGLDLFEWQIRPFLLVWIAVPIPLVYWLGRKLARTNVSFAIVLFGLLIAFAFAVWVYWDITWGPARRTESMSGLMFLFGPLYQFVWLAVILLIAALTARAARRK